MIEKISFKTLKNYGIKIKGHYFDNKIAHYLINPDLSHNFKTLCEGLLKL